ncbi:DNA-directed RNA polymerase III subunit RPC8, partial [Cichlidogyrus casuarinus]
VIYKVGLCIGLWDILDVQESKVRSGDGCLVTPDEVILGSVKGCDKNGVHVSLSFFDDIIIPPEKLRHPSKFDINQACWSWEYCHEGEKVDLKIEKNDTIRFKVVDEIWRDPNPADFIKPGEISREQASPYTIVVSLLPILSYKLSQASIVADGLGLTCWWL